MIAKEVDLALLLDDSLWLMKRADAWFAGSRWRARASTRRQRSGSATSRIDNLRIATASPITTTPIHSNSMTAIMNRWPSRYSETRSRILSIPAFLLLSIDVIRTTITRCITQSRWHPIEILLKMSPTAATTARLKRKIVSFLRPQILMTLSLWPATRPSTILQISQHSLFPRIETFAMHKLTDSAAIIVARNLDRVLKQIHSNRQITSQTFTGRRATLRSARTIASINSKIIKQIVIIRCSYLKQATYVAIRSMTSRCHCTNFVQFFLRGPDAMSYHTLIRFPSKNSPFWLRAYHLRLRLFLEDESSEVWKYLGRQVIFANFRQCDAFEYNCVDSSLNENL